MQSENTELSLSETELLQALKTGAIIEAAANMGCILGNADEEAYAVSCEYARKIGLAFQIKDDILNVEGDAEKLGKDVGNDEESGKSTFVKLLGLEQCKARLAKLTEDAVGVAKKLPDSEFLIWLAYELLAREN